MSRIHSAIARFDLDRVRSELDEGVDPNLDDPLLEAVIHQSNIKFGAQNLETRVAIVAALLEAGASVNSCIANLGKTALHLAVVNKYFGVIVDMLMAAGADVNAESGSAERGNAGDGSVLAEAAKSGSTATVAKLISAGARHLNQALQAAIGSGCLRNCGILLRSGAALRAESWYEWYEHNGLISRRVIPLSTRAYIRRIDAVGGFKAYDAMFIMAAVLMQYQVYSFLALVMDAMPDVQMYGEAAIQARLGQGFDVCFELTGDPTQVPKFPQPIQGFIESVTRVRVDYALFLALFTVVPQFSPALAGLVDSKAAFRCLDIPDILVHIAS